jgi:hypothetical protein
MDKDTQKGEDKTNPHEVSVLWQHLCEELYSNVDDKFLSGFREPDNPANRFSTWQPKESTFRYYLTLVFNEVRKKDENFFINYKKLGDTLLGSPLCVSAQGVQVNLDYLTSIEEYDFLCRNLDSHKIESVVEIGAGFGRTAHTLLKLCPNIKKYTIIDLEPMLKISSKYLQKVLTGDASKLKFIAANNFGEWRAVRADLGINIDSFQEMPKQTIASYIDDLLAKVNSVYIKNPVCKYNPNLLGIEGGTRHDVFSLGLMTEVANIFDEVELTEMRKIYAARYCPSLNHKVLNASPSELFSYFQHILYSKI